MVELIKKKQEINANYKKKPFLLVGVDRQIDLTI